MSTLTEYVCEAIGGKGKITADGQEFAMGYKDCLYITKGTKEVYFESEDPSDPAKFYMVSAPAHTSYTTTFIPIEKAAKSHVVMQPFLISVLSISLSIRMY